MAKAVYFSFLITKLSRYSFDKNKGGDVLALAVDDLLDFVFDKLGEVSCALQHSAKSAAYCLHRLFGDDDANARAVADGAVDAGEQ